MTGSGHVGTADVAPPPFISFKIARGRGLGWHPPSGMPCCVAPQLPARRPRDVEAVAFRNVGDALAELRRGRLQGAGELDDRRQPRLPGGALEQRDLGPVEIAEVAQLFL